MQFVSLHRKTLHSLRRCFLLALILSLALEVFVFNFNYFTSTGYATVNISERINQGKTRGEGYTVSEVNRVLEFSNVNMEIKNIKLSFYSDQPAQLLDVGIHFTDEAHLTYFDSTEYTTGVPSAQVATNNERSQYIRINATGLINNLRIEIGGDEAQYPILLEGVYVNASYPFEFNVLRFFLVMGIVSLLYVFRPKSSIYHSYIKEEAKKSKLVISAAVFVEVVLMSSFLLYGSNLVGVASSSYNWGSWDGRSIVNTFEVGGDNAQQYAELAKSLTEGKLYLEEDPPQWLQDMQDPYDKGAREQAQRETGETYLFDVAYFDGHYYVYFGVVPVLLFYLPFYILFGTNFPTAIGVLISCIAFVLGISALLDRFARYHFERVSLGLYLLLQIPLVFCSGVLYLLKFPTFYSLPIILGLAFSAWGLYFWMRGRVSNHASPWYLAGSACMALVLGCRPQLVVLSLVAFPLFWRKFISQKHILTRQGSIEFICLLGPYVIVAAALLWYNKARFGSPFDFGANYNLTVHDMTKRTFSFGRFAPAFFAYFLQTPSTTGVFPFIQAAPFETSYMGQTVKEVTFGGIFACLPLLWILPFAKRILKRRIDQRSSRTIAGVLLVLLASGVIVALLDAQMAGILQRYFADFSFMFLAAAVLLIFIVNENLNHKSPTARLLAKVLLILVALSLLYSSLLCFVPETGWYSDVYPWSYQSVIEMFQFWS